jgi:hypothetical protein
VLATVRALDVTPPTTEDVMPASEVVSVYQSFREGGWAMYPIFAFGLPGMGVAGRFAWVGEHQLVPFVRYNSVALLLTGAFGTCIGLMQTLWFVTERAPESERWVTLLIGIRESLNNAAAALLFAALTYLLLGIGYRRFPALNPSAAPR